jgi:LPXTG-motif cell wall-anchored protein
VVSRWLSAVASEEPSEEPELPDTGSSLTGLLWSAAALLLGGIAVMLFASDLTARRRRQTAA